MYIRSDTLLEHLLCYEYCAGHFREGALHISCKRYAFPGNIYLCNTLYITSMV